MPASFSCRLRYGLFFEMMQVSLARRAVALAILFWASQAYAGDISGTASVIDADTIEIHDTRIRLHGVDAPESGQSCDDERGQTYPCGRIAAFALSDKIGRSSLTCEQKDKDRYGRVVAVCALNGENLNEWLVASGWAVAYTRYSKDYTTAEAKARAAKKGIWRGSFIAPAEWRRGKRQAATAPAVPAATERTCCKVCRKGIPCGNSCISAAKTCRQPPGCAC